MLAPTAEKKIYKVCTMDLFVCVMRLYIYVKLSEKISSDLACVCVIVLFEGSGVTQTPLYVVAHLVVGPA